MKTCLYIRRWVVPRGTRISTSTIQASDVPACYNHLAGKFLVGTIGDMIAMYVCSGITCNQTIEFAALDLQIPVAEFYRRLDVPEGVITLELPFDSEGDE